MCLSNREIESLSHLSGALRQFGRCLGTTDERRDLLGRVITCVVVGTHNRVDHLAIVGHLCEHTVLHDLCLARLHGREDFRLLAFGHTAEANR